MAKKGWGKIVAAMQIIGTAVAASIAYLKKYRQLLDSCKDEYDDYDEDLEEEDEDVDFIDDEPGSSTQPRENMCR